MKKFLSGLLGVGLLLGLVASAFSVTPTTIVNNAAYTILPTDVRVVTGPTAFTASRTWTLPDAGQTCIGQNCAPAASALEIVDNGNAISTAFPLVIAPASGNTINGSTSSITITAGLSRVVLFPLTPSSWQLTINAPVQTAVGGTAPTVFNTGGALFPSVSSGNDSTAVNTETYISEIYIPVQTTLTGVQWMGLATSTGNVQFSLADSTGAVITAAQTASTATAATANYQTAAFAATYLAKPGKYFLLMQNSGSNHYRAHTIGVFGCSKKTGETYGTFTAVTAPTTFTTNLCPIAATY
jgi:hypothetical protein